MSYQSPLTEDVIKQRFIPFLKDFYRHRYEPMPNTTEVSFDNVAEGGLVADGMMRFRKSDNSPFLCAYEATSLDKIGEVKFVRNVRYFLWDCVAFGLVVAAIAYLIAYYAFLLWLVKIHWIGNVGFIAGFFLLGALGWYFTMGKWRKYRFIHAIEQFKLYRADEQWIALGEDVFPARNDPFFQELRHQCTYNGFGLAIVPFDGFVEKIQDPSRLSIYGEDRSMAHWLTRTQWYQAFQQGKKAADQQQQPPSKIKATLNKVLRPLKFQLLDPLRRAFQQALGQPLGYTASAYTRFMQGQRVQKMITALSLTALIVLFALTLSHTEEDLTEWTEVNTRPKGKNPEDQPFSYFEHEVAPITGVPRQNPERRFSESNYATRPAAEAEEIQTLDLSGDDDEDTEAPAPTPKTSVKKAAPAPAKPKPKPIDPCKAWQGKRGYYLQESVFDNQQNADARAAKIKAAGITCTVLPKRCITAGDAGFIIQVGSLHIAAAEAKQQATSLGAALRKAKLGTGKLIVKQL
ncbi:MAG: hypothetical protein J0L99_18960 [Chitinophagales bacterium]|nr:hypothetical protein [Chitinophagales bacterium]